MAAVKIGFRRLGRDVNNPTFFVQRLTGPWHEAGGGLVGFSGPGVVTQFSRTRNQMENPAPQSGPNIEGANSTGTAEAANDQKILIGDARCVKPDGRCPLHIEAGAKMNGTVLAEASNRLARFRIERVEVITNSSEESLFATGFILPEDKAALPGVCPSGPFGLRVPLPEFTTGSRVESNDLACRGSSIKHAGDN